MLNYFKLAALGMVMLFAAIAANFARDIAYQVHAILIMLVSFGTFVWVLRNTDEAPVKIDKNGYMDGVIRAGVIATAFWGVTGFLVGVIIAFQLAFPVLNIEWAQGFTNFGRLRPLHTSAVIFAFGGNALIMSSFYVVQRTSGSRLWGGTCLGSCFGAISCSSSWRQRAMCSALPKRKNTPSLNGMLISG